MRNDAADPRAAQQTVAGDARVTKIGRFIRKTSIDELPQLLNVLKGEMSLVGPRPMLTNQQALYPGQAYYKMRPGMTGLAQISGRNELDYEERFKCDVWYVDHHNVFVDFKIMFKTVSVMTNREGVNAPGHVGPSLFKGNDTQTKNDEVKS